MIMFGNDLFPFVFFGSDMFLFVYDLFLFGNDALLVGNDLLLFRSEMLLLGNDMFPMFCFGNDVFLLGNGMILFGSDMPLVVDGVQAGRDKLLNSVAEDRDTGVGEILVPQVLNPSQFSKKRQFQFSHRVRKLFFPEWEKLKKS